MRALTRLRRALEEARTKARDAYFGPVLRELQPLLAILTVEKYGVAAGFIYLAREIKSNLVRNYI